MPGHKGVGPLGYEKYDITEVDGADSLYTAGGIIAQSEANASRLFGCPTFYSTEGSSHCIRAMLYLATRQNRRVLALRNCHTAFLSAAALLDLEVTWVSDVTELSVTSDHAALYVTSPDYLGRMCDISALAALCRRQGVKLLVDNAHGAYLRFLTPSRHPMDLGADLCCDSAHKTLPVLTGGAYLHTRERDGVKEALALFGSTSPSYLTLQSLDAANVFLESFRPRLSVPDLPFDRVGNEPLKITLAPKSRGYTGLELAEILRKNGYECEFADPDYLVLMPRSGEDLSALASLLDLPTRPPILQAPPMPHIGRAVMSIREAMMAESERVDAADAIGRILAQPSVFCPPAIPILVCGEIIDESALAAFAYYGIEKIRVVK
jgi:arginine/lysine/ornithine decarboxylase